MRVLLVTDHYGDGIAFYRSSGPWNDIQKEYAQYDIHITRVHAKEHFGWDIFTAHDVLFISNPRTPKHFDIIKSAQSYGVKVWSDYDDCYLDIPEDNQAFNILTAGLVTQLTKDCLIASDITTVTTNYLKEVFSPYTTRVEVIPNAFPLELLADQCLGPMIQAGHNFVSWRGSSSHEVNLMEYADEIEQVAINNLDWKFNFFGMKPKFFRGKFKYQHYDFVPLMDSFYRMKRMSSKIHIVTLYERPFNLSKSNICWIEATLAGSVVLAPDWEEWRKPGIVNYSSKEDFKVKLDAMIKGEYNLTELFEQSRDYIFNNLSLKNVNKERIKILQRLCVAGKEYTS